MSNLKASLEARIATLLASEKVTHVELGAASREALHYVPETQDIGMVNRLINVLTPANKAVAAMFFAVFLPWKWDTETNMFVGKIKGQAKIDNKLIACAEFLKDETNTIWTWTKENVQIAERAKNYPAQIAALVTRATKDDKYGVDAKAVVNAVLLGGVTLDDIMNIVTEAAAVRKAEQDKLANDNAGKVEQPAVAAE